MAGRDQIDDGDRNLFLEQRRALGNKSPTVLGPVLVRGTDDLHGGHQAPAPFGVVDAHLIFILGRQVGNHVDFDRCPKVDARGSNIAARKFACQVDDDHGRPLAVKAFPRCFVIQWRVKVVAERHRLFPPFNQVGVRQVDAFLDLWSAAA